MLDFYMVVVMGWKMIPEAYKIGRNCMHLSQCMVKKTIQDNFSRCLNQMV